jgi:multicomponent Na+:H+ antiporter subunit G
MSMALDIFTIVAVTAGAFFFLAGTAGLLRFPDAFTRLHALTKADNLGLGLVILGLLPRVDNVFTGFKLICVWLLVLLSGSVASQLIARAERRRETRP